VIYGRTEKLGNDLRRGVSDRILDRAFQVDEDLTAFLDTFDGGGEVVIKEDHISSLFGHIRARHIHRNAKVRALQCRRIIDAITSTVASS
jgi:hypothetical protein